MIDGALVHGEELHAAEAQAVGGVDLPDQGLVGVQALGQPPAQLGAELDGGLREGTGEIVEGHGGVSLRSEGVKRFNQLGRMVVKFPEDNI